MSLLEELISTLDEADCDRFLRSVEHNSPNDRGVDKNTFTRIKMNDVDQLKGENTYHASRKRLVEKLIHFIHSEEILHHQSTDNRISTYLSVAQYLMRHKAESSGWKLLRKSEKLALEYELYEQLNRVLLAQIEFAYSNEAPPLDDILSHYHRNKEAQQMEERMSIALQLIEQQLKIVIFKGQNQEFFNVVQRVFSDFEIDVNKARSVKQVHRLISISRNIAKERKAFTELKPFILKEYIKLTENQKFNKSNYHFHLSIVYMLCHTLYRVRSFDELHHYLDKFEHYLHTYPGSVSRPFQSRYTFLKANHYCFTNQLENAITLLEEYVPSLSDEDQIVRNLNLSLFYFMNKQYSAALRQNNKIGRTEKWLTSKMGLEWVMKRQLMEIIIHFHLGNIEVMDSRIRSFRQRFSSLLKEEKYGRVTPFIDFIRQKTHNTIPELSTLESILVTVPSHEEDLQAMSFYAWIKSKAIKKDFYETLVTLVNNKAS